eukprot:GGOE01037789.1.p1 GENE.GGOE01037789.1~~GGOE01037789.1.p1  ORF type:complete len:390 (-),score=92.19 GGOE01037789.1:229-1398(-)
MYVEGVEDAEADLAAGIRACIGPTALIAASTDLHGNISRKLVELVDIFTTYRTAPHIDVTETREKAYRLLVECLDAGVRPVRAFVSVPVLLPGERTCTTAEPGGAFYRSVAEFDATPGILDVSFWVGYVWADEARSSATCIVTGTDPTAISHAAEVLARRYWALRDAFAFGVPAGSPSECIEHAVAAAPGQLAIISDSGDNPTGGGAGDVPVMLHALLSSEALQRSGRRVVFASMPAPRAVEACFAAGENSTVECTVGGELDPIHGHAIALRGVVQVLHEGDVHAQRQVVLCCGLVTVILTQRRKPFHHLHDFTILGLDLLAFDILCVKLGYLVPELAEVAGLALLALTPGAVHQDVATLSYRKVSRPMFPLETEFDFSPDVQLFHSTA